MGEIIHVLNFFLPYIINDITNNVDSFPYLYLRNAVKLQIRNKIYQNLLVIDKRIFGNKSISFVREIQNTRK